MHDGMRVGFRALTESRASARTPFSTSFSVGKALREHPDVSLWTWSSPRRGPCDALEITFDRPFDRHLVNDAIHLSASDGRNIAGTPNVGANESAWSFTPKEAWTESGLRVTVDDALEDVSGNNFCDLLDTNLNEETKRTL